MAFAELDLRRIDRTVGDFCRRKSPPKLRDQVRLEYRVTRHEVLVYETRPAFRDRSHWIEHGVARNLSTTLRHSHREFTEQRPASWLDIAQVHRRCGNIRR